MKSNLMNESSQTPDSEFTTEKDPLQNAGQNQRAGQDQNACQFQKARPKRMKYSMLRGILIDVFAAVFLFSSFYIGEYGLPFTTKVYAVVSETAASQLLINQTATEAASADEDTSSTTTAAANAAAATNTTAAADAAAAVISTVTDNTYTSDNLKIMVTTCTSGSGNSLITWYVADIQVTDLSLLSTCFADDTYGQGITDYVLNMANDNNAVLAVNGDYYSEQKNNIVIRNGELYEEADTSSDLCVLYKDGTIVTYSAGEIDASTAIANGAWQAWNFGPALLSDDGTALTSFNTSSRIASENPRTAIGYYEPGHYCLVVVDGRSPGYSKGMTLTELAQMFEDLGCTQAYNLDGGKSSVMVFNGTVVNQPSEGGREVSDAIIVG